MNEKHQTAVEYLFSIMYHKRGIITMEEYIEALEMEKKQQEIAFSKGEIIAAEYFQSITINQTTTPNN